MSNIGNVVLIPNCVADLASTSNSGQGVSVYVAPGVKNEVDRS